MLIWYLLIVSVGFLTTSTVAYYSDHKPASGSMTIGTWESEEKVHQKEDITNGSSKKDNEMDKQVAKAEQKSTSSQLNEKEEETIKDNYEKQNVQSGSADEQEGD